MKTVVLGDIPPALDSHLAERKRLGLDTHDEVWTGDYYMAPAASFNHAKHEMTIGRLLFEKAEPLNLVVTGAFNLGSPDNFRVPDLGVHRGDPEGTWIASASVIVEVRSPDDETYNKFDFYFEHNVDEILVADLTSQTVHWFIRTLSGFEPSSASAVLGLTSQEVASALDW